MAGNPKFQAWPNEDTGSKFQCPHCQGFDVRVYFSVEKAFEHAGHGKLELLDHMSGYYEAPELVCQDCDESWHTWVDLPQTTKHRKERTMEMSRKARRTYSMGHRLGIVLSVYNVLCPFNPIDSNLQADGRLTLTLGDNSLDFDLNTEGGYHKAYIWISCSICDVLDSRMFDDV